MTETHQLADNTVSAHRVPYMDRMPVSPLMLARAFSLSLSLSLSSPSSCVGEKLLRTPCRTIGSISMEY